jgi:8-oxo-dGTP pyrophosphatase MutT (NUDIX family)
VSASDEQVAIYDEFGHVVGSAPRWRMRRDGLWHAATAVLVRSPDGMSVYVHRRTDTKEMYPGMHDCLAGGVVGAGEEPDAAAARELAEELGVTGVELTPLFQTVYEQGTVRFHVFCYEAFWDGPIVHQSEEIADGGWMSLSELRTRLADPSWPFVPDGRQFIEMWFARQDSLSKPADQCQASADRSPQ